MPPSRRRATATAVSIVLHVLLLCFLLGSMQGAVAGLGGGAPYGDANAVVVSLAGLRGGGSTPHAAHPADRLATMLDALAAQPADNAAQAKADGPRRPQDLQALLNEVEASRSGGGQSDLDRGGAGAAANGRRDISAERAGDRADGQGQGRGAAGDLWGQVAPCWRRLAPPGAVAVTLDIQLDSQGRLAGPPRIVRPRGAVLGNDRYVSETRAIQALIACLPYRGVGKDGGQLSYRVEFRAAG